ncbi:hypothetical protein BAE44_0013373 [Dichanthelium oligosanthes]|uniref:Uncharacterized protein n=1 Tax=Dichanthelium oligosanthes TaxID=888268 RepID=A0A1E5VKG7_9POAL|nr:hypothetical protein BAE44_0013373 [Dichanthelium oligosanthes]
MTLLHCIMVICTMAIICGEEYLLIFQECWLSP